MAGESVLARMAVEIAGNTASFSKSMQAAQGQLKDFTSGVTKAGAIIGGVFAAKEIASFAFELANLSGEADGVRKAFEKLPDSARLMNDLKTATAGTVSELELMKRAVQASNFGISMEALPKLLEFAAVRAQQTGQSVDYLVDSIVTGIGRKSPLILDNLGISAVALKEKLGDVSIAAADVGQVADAVGQIAGDSLKEMGSLAENTSTKTQRLSATWENFKVTLGDVINNTGILQKAMNGLIEVMNLLKDGQDDSRTGDFSLLAAGVKSGDDKALVQMVRRYQLLRAEVEKPFNEGNVQAIIKKYELSEIEAERFLKLVREINGEVARKVEPVKVVETSQIETLATLQEKLKGLNEAFEQINITDQKGLAIKGQEIIATAKQIDALEKLRKARKDALLAPESIEFYKSQLSDLNDELEKVNKNDLSRIRILSAQIAGYTEAIDRIEGLKKSIIGLNSLSINPPSTKALLDPISKVMRQEGGLSFEVDISLSEQVKERFEKSMLDFQKRFQALKQPIVKTGIDIGQSLSGAIGSALSGLGEALGNAIAGTEKFGTSILKVVAGFAKQLGEILIATGVAMLAAKALITNPYTAIIAGVALVALASAASASISKAHSGSFGGSSGGAGKSSGGYTGGAESFSPSNAPQFVLVGGEIKWNGSTLMLAINEANRQKQRTG